MLFYLDTTILLRIFIIEIKTKTIGTMKARALKIEKALPGTKSYNLVIERMASFFYMNAFIAKAKELDFLSFEALDSILPDYVSGADLYSLFS